jgi:hypothetical protein
MDFSALSWPYPYAGVIRELEGQPQVSAEAAIRAGR